MESCSGLHCASQEQCYVCLGSHFKAVGTGPAGPAAAGPIFGQPINPRKNAVHELRRGVQFLLQAS